MLCAGVEGAFAIDDAYVAGRIAAALGGEPDDAAVAAIQLAGSFATSEDGIGAGVSAENIRNVRLDEDIAWCARESVLDLRAADRRARAGLGHDRAAVEPGATARAPAAALGRDRSLDGW